MGIKAKLGKVIYIHGSDLSCFNVSVLTMNHPAKLPFSLF